MRKSRVLTPNEYEIFLKLVKKLPLWSLISEGKLDKDDVSAIIQWYAKTVDEDNHIAVGDDSMTTKGFE